MASAAERRWGAWKEGIQMWRPLSHTNGPLEISNSFHPLILVSVYGDLWMAPGHGGARCFCLADKRSVWRLNVITTKGLNLPLYTMSLWGTKKTDLICWLMRLFWFPSNFSTDQWFCLPLLFYCLSKLEMLTWSNAHFLSCFKKFNISWFK